MIQAMGTEKQPATPEGETEFSVPRAVAYDEITSTRNGFERPGEVSRDFIKKGGPSDESGHDEHDA
jgi:hypothetical protein